MHIVRTLRDDDNPLQVRDEMLIYLKQKELEQDSVSSRNSFIAPKLQWFFVPADPLSNIPSSVNLEGYCTDMEEKNEQNDDTDSDASEEEGEEEVTAYDQNNIFARAQAAGDWPRAERSALRRALLNPNDHRPWLDVAAAREKQGSLAGALEALARARTVDDPMEITRQMSVDRVRLQLN